MAFKPVLQNSLTLFLRTSPKLRMLGSLSPPLTLQFEYLSIEFTYYWRPLDAAFFSRLCEKIAFVEFLVKIYWKICPKTYSNYACKNRLENMSKNVLKI